MSKITRRRIASAIAEKTLQTAPSKQLAKEVAAYLIANRRTSQLESLMRDIMQYRADHGIVEAEAITAHSLDDKQTQALKAQIKSLYPNARQIIISQKLDPSVIGSIRLELANQQFDASLRSKLNHFKQLTTVTKG